MIRRAGALACALLLAAGVAACSSDSKTNTSNSGSTSSATGGSDVVTVMVDGHGPSSMNFASLAYFPSKLTAAAGSTVRFKSAFTGEPHTVAFGTSIDTEVKYIDAHPDAENGPPPQEIVDLGIPGVFPDGPPPANAPPGPPALNQSAAQPCVVAAGGKIADPAPACTDKKPTTLDGKAAILNSGLLLTEGETWDLKLADDLAPGDYSWICLFHGPHMRGTLTVVAKGGAAQSASDVSANGKKELDDAIAKLQPVIDKAKAAAEPGKVTASAGDQQLPYVDEEFVPNEISIKAGDKVTWNLSFHTVTFNAPEDAHGAFTKAADGTVSFNGKAVGPSGYTPPGPPAGASSSSAASSASSSSDSSGSSSGAPSTPPTMVDATWDGVGFFNSGSLQQQQEDVFFSVTFTKAGTYNYICTIHPDMKGVVKVS